MAKQAQIYQFKITLKGVKPKIWRRILVPESFTFWDLHVAIQDAMGWTNAHLHEFKVFDPQTGEVELIGIPDEDGFDDFETKPGWKTKIKKYFSEGMLVPYVYDFGDDWKHSIVLEKILPKTSGAKYPICLAGKRACPPEDCGGVWGYENLLAIINDPKHEEFESMKEWLGGDFNPEAFNAKEVVFMDPKQSLKYIL